MKISVFTSFPEFFDVLKISLLGKSLLNKIWSFNAININKYGIGKRKNIDDYSYGGGSGMILRPDVIGNAIEQNIPNRKNKEIILTSPRGEIFDQKIAIELAQKEDLYIITNRFEGIDQRAINYYNLREISIGNYILFGGDVAALVMIEAIIRLLPGVIDSHDKEDSFSEALNEMLEYDHYTKPAIWNLMQVPDILLSGNHEEVKKWKYKNSKQKTELSKNKFLKQKQD